MPAAHPAARLCCALALALSAGAATAADPDPPLPSSDALAPARAQIAQAHWAEAVAELKRLGDGGSADWNNLMGYSLRHLSPPDYPGAERFYEAALRIDPRHRGALEYSGELYLMLGDLPRAEQRLAALDKACFLPCAEYTDLKKAVARFKANGNKFVAAP